MRSNFSKGMKGPHGDFKSLIVAGMEYIGGGGMCFGRTGMLWEFLIWEAEYGAVDVLCTTMGGDIG